MIAARMRSWGSFAIIPFSHSEGVVPAVRGPTEEKCGLCVDGIATFVTIETKRHEPEA